MAGSTEALQELIERREDWEARRGDRLSKIEMYNDEAVGTIMDGDDDEPWVFATVRPGSSASVAESAVEIGTVKKIATPPSVTICVRDKVDIQALRRIDVNNAGTDKNRTVRPRTASKDAMTGSPSKTTRRIGDTATVRTVSRSIKLGENVGRTPEKRHSNPSPRSPEKSILGRKFATTVMQPAFEQVHTMFKYNLIVVTTTIEKVTCGSRGSVTA
jgi:serine/threonine-protein kinase 24/25/MST4